MIIKTADSRQQTADSRQQTADAITLIFCGYLRLMQWLLFIRQLGLIPALYRRKYSAFTAE